MLDQRHLEGCQPTTLLPVAGSPGGDLSRQPVISVRSLQITRRRCDHGFPVSLLSGHFTLEYYSSHKKDKFGTCSNIDGLGGQYT